MTGAEPRLRATDLRLRLGETDILTGVELAVARGELAAVVGPNGAGKSTLLRCLAGLHPQARGELLVDSRPVADFRRRELAKIVSFVPQTELVGDGYTVRAIVEMGRYPHLATWSAFTEADRRAVDEALELTATGHLAPRQMATLSSGERQRVVIAAALAQGGSILLLDEPTSFLDVHHQIQVLELLDRLHSDRGYTVVAVTHDLNGLTTDADSVLAMVGGRVAFAGPPRELFEGSTLARIFGNEFVMVPGGRHGLPLVVPARRGS
jgi:iron complex transport system ATP-binding protein